MFRDSSFRRSSDTSLPRSTSRTKWHSVFMLTCALGLPLSAPAWRCRRCALDHHHAALMYKVTWLCCPALAWLLLCRMCHAGGKSSSGMPAQPEAIAAHVCQLVAGPGLLSLIYALSIREKAAGSADMATSVSTAACQHVKAGCGQKSTVTAGLCTTDSAASHSALA